MMKTLNDYLAMSYRMEIVEDRNEGGFVVSFPELPGCIACGDTIESAVANAENGTMVPLLLRTYHLFKSSGIMRALDSP